MQPNSHIARVETRMQLSKCGEVEWAFTTNGYRHSLQLLTEAGNCQCRSDAPSPPSAQCLPIRRSSLTRQSQILRACRRNATKATRHTAVWNEPPNLPGRTLRNCNHAKMRRTPLSLQHSTRWNNLLHRRTEPLRAQGEARLFPMCMFESPNFVPKCDKKHPLPHQSQRARVAVPSRARPLDAVGDSEASNESAQRCNPPCYIFHPRPVSGRALFVTGPAGFATPPHCGRMCSENPWCTCQLERTCTLTSSATKLDIEECTPTWLSKTL